MEGKQNQQKMSELKEGKEGETKGENKLGKKENTDAKKGEQTGRKESRTK